MAELMRSCTEHARERVRSARAREPERALRARAADAPRAPRLELDAGAFTVFAELKPRSPSAGALAGAEVSERALTERAVSYAEGGAAAISVLTEPAHFGGSLALLRAVAAGVGLPVMRKDFLVDPYQVFEARAAGASGVLLVVRTVSDATLGELLAAALEEELFTLVEVFDDEDLARLEGCLDAEAATPQLVGVNTRDLATLAIDDGRLAALARSLPEGHLAVAESGIASPADAERAAALGYGAALVGTALMRAADPRAAVAELVTGGRQGAKRA